MNSRHRGTVGTEEQRNSRQAEEQRSIRRQRREHDTGVSYSKMGGGVIDTSEMLYGTMPE